MRQVAILMAVYNGTRFLQGQLDSFAAQEGVDWRLIASDDGSTDDSAAIVARFAAAHPGRVEWVDGPHAGAEANFRSLLDRTPDSADYAAFSDQDDVWLPGKLSRAVAALERVAPGQPALYCSRTRVVDDDLRPRGLTRRLRRRPSFRNALVQNIAGGNTMVMNRAAVVLLKAAHAEAGPVAIHDWWVYQMITGVDGPVIFDDEPGLLYRQHDQNEIGANAGFRAAWGRAKMLAQGRFARWNRMNAAALMASAHRLTLPNRKALIAFDKALRAPRLRDRLGALWASGAYRQSRQSNIALWIAALTGKL